MIQLEDNIRDQTFDRLKQQHENDKCIDCEKKNTKWASINLGLFLCIDCVAKHRSWGPSLSLCRSLTLDSWSQRQLLFMENGGNQKLLDYLKKHGIIVSQQQGLRNIDFKSEIVAKYKQELAFLVDTIEKKQTRQNNQAQQNQASKSQQEQQKQSQQDIIKNETSTQASKSQETSEQDKKKKDTFNNNLISSNNSLTKEVKFPTKKYPENNAKANSKQMKAEKIDDIDFDNLVFDDGVSNQKSQEADKFEDYKQEQAAPVVQISSNIMQDNNNNNNQQEKKDINADLFQKMKNCNVKAISSDSLFSKNTQLSKEEKQTLNKFSGQTAISSNAFFGLPEQENQGGQETGNNLEQLKTIISNVKDQATNIINKIKDRIK